LCADDYSPEIIQAWSAPEAIELYRDSINTNPFYVAEDEGCVVGFAVLEVELSRVRAIYVAPEHARKGVGSSLLAELEREARERGLQELQLESSLTAVPFYEACGFSKLREKQFELPGGVEMDAIIMGKSLAELAV